jgi:hypothetical protein
VHYSTKLKNRAPLSDEDKLVLKAWVTQGLRAQERDRGRKRCCRAPRSTFQCPNGPLARDASCLVK